MTTVKFRFATPRPGVLFATLLLSSIVQAQSPEPGEGTVNENPQPPNCPESLLGQVEGAYYYATSNCNGVTGFGQSPDLIPLPQCTNQSCGRSVSTPGGPLEAPDQIPQEELDGWKASIRESITRFIKEIEIRTEADSRRRTLLDLKRDAEGALRQLDSPLLTGKQKFQLNSRFNLKLGEYEKATQRLGLAGDVLQKIYVEDRPLGQGDQGTDQVVAVQGTSAGPALKAASAVSFDTTKANGQNSNVSANNRYQVRSETGDVLKVRIGGGKFAFFQTFRLTATKVGAGPSTTLYIGIQVAETSVAREAEFSERGNYAHRIKNKNGTPFLVNSIEPLGANP